MPLIPGSFKSVSRMSIDRCSRAFSACSADDTATAFSPLCVATAAQSSRVVCSSSTTRMDIGADDRLEMTKSETASSVMAVSKLELQVLFRKQPLSMCSSLEYLAITLRVGVPQRDFSG